MVEGTTTTNFGEIMNKNGITYIAGLLYKNGKEIGHPRKKGDYLRIQMGVNKVTAHRFIWEMFNGKIESGMQIDHINGNRQDNRIENLQCITHDANNKRKNHAKGYTIKKDMKNRPYKAQKKFNGVQHYSGFFGTPCGAYMANRTFFI